MKVSISDRAHRNIDSIFEYISYDSLKYANKTIENIYSRIYMLEFSPYLGRYVPELSSKYYRELIYKSYRIVYTIDEETNIVYIHYVTHSKKDFNPNFFLN